MPGTKKLKRETVAGRKSGCESETRLEHRPSGERMCTHSETPPGTRTVENDDFPKTVSDADAGQQAAPSARAILCLWVNSRQPEALDRLETFSVSLCNNRRSMMARAGMSLEGICGNSRPRSRGMVPKEHKGMACDSSHHSSPGPHKAPREVVSGNNRRHKRRSSSLP